MGFYFLQETLPLKVPAAFGKSRPFWRGPAIRRGKKGKNDAATEIMISKTTSWREKDEWPVVPRGISLSGSAIGPNEKKKGGEWLLFAKRRDGVRWRRGGPS